MRRRLEALENARVCQLGKVAGFPDGLVDGLLSARRSQRHIRRAITACGQVGQRHADLCPQPVGVGIQPSDERVFVMADEIDDEV